MNRNDRSTGTTISAAGSFRSRPNKITPAPRINSINENALIAKNTNCARWRGSSASGANAIAKIGA